MRLHGTSFAFVAAAVIASAFAGLLLAHEHHAPHQGALVCLGDEVGHVELSLDASAGVLDLWILDGEAEKPVRLAQKRFTLKVTPLEPTGRSFTLLCQAKADALTGESVGHSSEFAACDGRLKGLKRFKGVLGRLMFRGRNFKGVVCPYPEGTQETEEEGSRQ